MLFSSTHQQQDDFGAAFQTLIDSNTALKTEVPKVLFNLPTFDPYAHPLLRIRKQPLLVPPYLFFPFSLNETLSPCSELPYIPILAPYDLISLSA